ncbi:HIT-type Zinc finger family protein, partial [Prunus dulcis]
MSSLPCVKAHKLRTGCTGKRNQTNFVPLSQIDNNQLLSGYPITLKASGVLHPVAERNSCFYQVECQKGRKIKLDMTEGRNASPGRLNGDFIQRIVNENTKFCSIIENHLKPGPWNHQLRLFCEEQLDCLRLFIRKYPKGARSPLCELDIRVPIRQQLTNLLKMPLPLFANQSLKLMEEMIQRWRCSFKEEEIEEDNSYPKVFDLMKRETSSSLPHISSRSRCEKAPDDSLTRTLPATVATDNDSHSDSNAKERGLFEDMDFDFDQGLIDTYSNLIAEINPDDFLDLE